MDRQVDKGLWRSGERPSPEITIGEIIGVWMDFKAKRLDEIIRGNECGSMVSKLCLQPNATSFFFGK